MLYSEIKNQDRKSLDNTWFYLAGVEGFEPSQAVLETDVLPLTLYPYEIYDTIIYDIKL